MRGLTASTTYYFKVQAVSGQGKVGPLSELAVATTNTSGKLSCKNVNGLFIVVHSTNGMIKIMVKKTQPVRGVPVTCVKKTWWKSWLITPMFSKIQYNRIYFTYQHIWHCVFADVQWWVALVLKMEDNCFKRGLFSCFLLVPGVPEKLRAYALSSSSIRVQWSAPANANEIRIIKYMVRT